MTQRFFSGEMQESTDVRLRDAAENGKGFLIIASYRVSMLNPRIALTSTG